MQFPKEGIEFLRSLQENNNRDWFTENKKAYEAHVKKPAAALCLAISEGLSELVGGPVEAKTFRINRDVRFSKDKTPYNAHMRFGFWESNSPTKKAMGGPAFYLSIEANALIIGAGCFALPPTLLEAYRRTVASGGDKLATLLQDAQKDGARIDPPSLKRIPSGFDKDHPHGELLKRKGLTCWYDHEITEARDITVNECLTAFEATLPVYRFIRGLEKP